MDNTSAQLQNTQMNKVQSVTWIYIQQVCVRFVFFSLACHIMYRSSTNSQCIQNKNANLKQETRNENNNKDDNAIEIYAQYLYILLA